MMSVFGRLACILVSSIGLFSFVAAQSQEQPIFSYDYCVKVRPGKDDDYTAFLRDVSTKIAQVRINDGTLAGYGVARAILPAGSTARCDYHILYSFVGWPTEGSREQTADAMKKAGLSMTIDEMLARRSADAYLVSADLWLGRASVGHVTKGSYLRLNYNKIKPGMMGDWLRMETTGWQKMVESLMTDHPGLAWGASTLVLPGGSALEYNAITYDGFPTWKAFGENIPVRDTWMKVHPQQDLSDYFERMGSLMDRPHVDVVKVEEVLRRQ